MYSLAELLRINQRARAIKNNKISLYIVVGCFDHDLLVYIA